MSAGSRWAAKLGVVVAVLALAIVETVNALVAPLLAPSDSDWRQASAGVRAGFRAGDLIVAAPPWSDQMMRFHLGDLVPLKVAARMDATRFGRVWEISQRGAPAPETVLPGAHMVQESRHGALRVRLVERPAARVMYDFVEQWGKAFVVRREPGRGDMECVREVDRHQCPDLGFNFVKPEVLEIDTTLHKALHIEPVGGSTVVVDFPAVPLGHELAVASGLHHVWLRRTGDGTVAIKVFIDRQPVGEDEAGNRTGWHVLHIDSSAWAGKTAAVRFEISSTRPYGRTLALAAEALDP